MEIKEKKLLKFSKDKEEILMFLWGEILQDANMENLQVYLTFIKTERIITGIQRPFHLKGNWLSASIFWTREKLPNECHLKSQRSD